MRTQKYSEAQKLTKETRTDADRERVLVDSAKFFNGYILDEKSLEGDFLKTASEEEKETFHNSTNWFDAMRPYFLRDKNQNMPLVFDLRRGCFAAAVCYVNAGANDFNNAEDNQGLCPSIILAANFYDQNVREENKPYLNDILYIYKKLKENHHGLNHKMISAYEKKHPDAKILEKFTRMNALLDIPEAERFSKKENEQQVLPKRGVWKRGLDR